MRRIIFFTWSLAAAVTLAGGGGAKVAAQKAKASPAAPARERADSLPDVEVLDQDGKSTRTYGLARPSQLVQIITGGADDK
ncbi:MAG: hypothetical protein ABR554_11680 [Pyrinomonadaceae bacterium]